MRPNPDAPAVSHAEYQRIQAARVAKFNAGKLFQQQVEGGKMRRLNPDRTAVKHVEPERTRKGKGTTLVNLGNREQRSRAGVTIPLSTPEQRAKGGAASRRKAEAARYGQAMREGVWQDPKPEAVEDRRARGREKAAEKKRAGTALRNLVAAVAKAATPDTAAAPLPASPQGDLFKMEAAV
jgi:hypothetical protein